MSAEFGGKPGREGLVGLGISSLIILALGGAGMVLFMPTAPVERAFGRVNGISFVDADVGSRLKARVTVGTTHELVSIPASAMCVAGGRIDLVKQKTLLKVRYTLGPGGCTQPDRR